MGLRGDRFLGRRRRVGVTLAIVAFAVVSALWLHFQPGGETRAVQYDDVAEGVAAWLAAAMCLRSFRRQRSLRSFWALLGASTFVWGVGEAVWVYYEVVRGVAVPFPSPADVGFLAAMPLMVAALLTFPVSRLARFGPVVMLLDGVLSAAATLFVSWAFVLGPLYRSPEGGRLAQAVTLAYPVSDVVIIVVLLWVLARAPRTAWLPLGLVGAGLLALTVSDSAFLYLSQSGGYGRGLTVDMGWIVGFLLIALASVWTPAMDAARIRSARPTPIGALVPYVPVAVALAVAVGYVVRSRNLGDFLVATGIVAMIALITRQLLALLDSLALGNTQQARFSALVRGSSDLTTIVRLDGTIDYQSPSSQTLLGCASDRLVGCSFGERVHPDDAPAFMRALGQVMDTPGAETTGEWRLRHEAGRYITTELRLANRLDDPSVRGVTINGRDVSERKQLEDELRAGTVHDSLTGLPNRTLLNDRLSHALVHHRRIAGDCDLAVLFIDIDDFKSVNDALGHAAGDELLRKAARRLESVVRTSDTVARSGGDEFALVLNSTLTASDLDMTVDRIRDVFTEPFVLAGTSRAVQASCGIAVATDPATDARTLLQQADIAMHAAKTNGKGSRTTYNPGMHEFVLDRLQLEADLRHAVARDELVVVYQPVINLDDGRHAALRR